MNQFFRVILALLIGSQLMAKPVIDPALKERFLSKKDTNITVIAKFKAQGPMNKRLAGKSPSEILKQKRIIASISQQSLSNQIHTLRQKTSDIQKMESLWINNSMIITAKTSFIRSLADRDDLERLDLDAKLRLFEPIEGTSEKVMDTQDSTYGLKKIQAMRVWNELGLNGEGVVVGVLDSGIDSDHESLSGRVLKTKDFVSSYEDNVPNDGHGHGTHCSGTIGGTNAGGKHIGVAPGVNFIMAKIFGDTGSTTTAAIMNGMQWITDPDNDPETNDFPRVVSNSWGGPLRDKWQGIINTWRSIGIIPVFAAGNSGPRPGTIGAPGAYKEVISIGATDSQDDIARFSSRGPVNYKGEIYIKPDISAPGVDVYSAKPGGGYQNMSGTSMATPHVAGVVALMLQANPDIEVERVREILQDTSLDLGKPGRDPFFGSGRINAFDAVSLVITGGHAAVNVSSGDQIATIKISPVNKTYTTNQDGEARIFLPAGNYQFTVQAFGYFAQTVDVEIVTQEMVDVDIELEQAPTFKLTFETKNSDGVRQNSNISFLEVPVQGGSTQGDLLEIDAPGGDYVIQVKTVGFETETINLSVRANTHLQIALINVPEYLIVNRSSAEDAIDHFYTAALDGLGKDYKLTKQIIPDIIAGYKKVIFYTGRNANTTRIATPEEQEILVQYVKNGGRLIMTGQDLGWALKTGTLYRKVIGATYIADKSPVKTVTNQTATFELDGGDSANNQKWPDVVAVNEELDDVEVLYTYEGRGPAITAHSYGAGKAAYIAFGFEGINGVAHRNTLIAELDEVINPTASESLNRMEWAFHQDSHAYQALLKNFKVTEQNKKEVQAYLEEKENKAPFRTIMQSMMNH